MLFQMQKPPLGTPLNLAHPLAKGLVGCWLMNEGSGNKIYDFSRNGNIGTLTNMDGATGGWTPGRSGQALKFDGVDDYVNVADSTSLSPTTAVTVSLRAKQDSLSNSKAMAAKWIYSTQGSWGLQTNNGTDGLNTSLLVYTAKSLTDAGVARGWTPNGSWTARVWHHVTFVYNGAGSGDTGRLKIYIDGVNQILTFNEVGQIPSSIPDSTAPINIGQFDPVNLSRPFNGSIDDVRIYNRVLTPQEVWKLYAAPYAMFERRPYWMNYVAPAGGLSIPVAMQHYKQLRAA